MKRLLSRGASGKNLKKLLPERSLIVCNLCDGRSYIVYHVGEDQYLFDNISYCSPSKK